jgi:hypothetical protein
MFSPPKKGFYAACFDAGETLATGRARMPESREEAS